MPEPPSQPDHEVPTRAPAPSDLGSPERQVGTVIVPAPDQRPSDYVDDCSEASFPASDPPSWWSGH